MERTGAKPAIYGGLFFSTLSTLMYEILLTRLFSVTMWYHFAFVAVSVALFGMTVGALLVYLVPRLFPEERTAERLYQATFLFSLTIVASCVIQLYLPINPAWSPEGVSSLGLIYLVTSVPFTFSGIAVCLSLTRFPAQVSRLYAVDLIGGALGAAGLIWLLNAIHDAPATVVVVAGFAGLGTCCFAMAAGRRRDLALAAASMAVLGGLALTSIVTVRNENAFLRVHWVKGREAEDTLYERWNTYSRVVVAGDPDVPAAPLGWGMSPTLPKGTTVRRVNLSLDSAAATMLYNFDGDIDKISFLKYDVVNIGHHLRDDADVLVVGAGGGADVQSALAFDQKSVTAIEMNANVLDAVNGRFGDFTGHLDQRPNVRFIRDEARSRLARMDQRFDLVQLSLIDTWAATAAGAFALSENGLYTVDAWQVFLSRLNENGIMSVSRWYRPDFPAEAYRLTSLAAESLREYGIDDPRPHIMLVRAPATIYPLIFVGTLLVSPQPFSAADILQLRLAAADLQFEVVLDPEQTIDASFERIIAGDLDAVQLGVPVNLAAPTDDSPFFFQMVRLWDAFGWDTGEDNLLTRSVLVLAALSITVVVLTAVFIAGPILLTTKRSALSGTAPHIAFFAAIGLAFILVEISQMQRLVIFLGHPTYALSVVLFSLLLFSGIGSLITERAVQLKLEEGLRPWQMWPLAGLLAVLVISGVATPLAIEDFEAATTPARILVATLLLAPMGLMMGMPFPLGMKVAALKPEAPTTFFWGVNGATSVCASVLAVAIALSWGISTAFWAGCLCYLVAAGALWLLAWRGRRAKEAPLAQPAAAPARTG